MLYDNDILLPVKLHMLQIQETGDKPILTQDVASIMLICIT